VNESRFGALVTSGAVTELSAGGGAEGGDVQTNAVLPGG
jgi:hypothetical protein